MLQRRRLEAFTSSQKGRKTHPATFCFFFTTFQNRQSDNHSATWQTRTRGLNKLSFCICLQSMDIIYMRLQEKAEADLRQSSPKRAFFIFRQRLIRHPRLLAYKRNFCNTYSRTWDCVLSQTFGRFRSVYPAPFKKSISDWSAYNVLVWKTANIPRGHFCLQKLPYEIKTIPKHIILRSQLRKLHLTYVAKRQSCLS